MGTDSRKTLFKITLAAAIPLGFLVAAELVTRLVCCIDPPANRYVREGDRLVNFPHFEQIGSYITSDPDLFWRLKPNVRGLRWEPPLWLDNRSNSLGLRDIQRVQAKQAGSLRILCLGDSCTFGSGVRLADTYPQRLEGLMARHYSDRLVEVWNGGVPGYTSEQGLVYLERHLDEIRPDIVLIAFGINDAFRWNPIQRADQNAGGSVTDRAMREQLNRPAAKIDRALAGLSQLYRAVQSWITSKMEPESAPSPEGGVGDARVPLLWFEENLERMIACSREGGAAGVLIVWPHRNQVQLREDEKPTPPNPYQRANLETGKKIGAPVLDLIKELKDNDEAIFVDSVHMNEKGCAKVAVRIGLFLEQQGLLPKKASEEVRDTPDKEKRR